MSDLLWPGDHHAGPLLTDADLLEAMLTVEAAWSGALVETGIAPPGAVVEPEMLRSAIRESDLEVFAVQAESGGNPVIPLVRTLRGRLDHPDAAAWLHRGLTSQDVIDSALMSRSKAAFGTVSDELEQQTERLRMMALEHRSSPMSARTLTQHAVPITFGYKCANWLAGLLDARDQVTGLRFPVQLGGAAGTMAAAVELAGVGAEGLVHEAIGRVADSLGLENVGPWHTVRTAITRCGDAAVTCTDSWGHIANDVATLSRPEIAELSEGEGGGSSTMPHKANPVLSVQIRRTALTAPQLAATLHLAAADATDERSPGAWHGEWDTLKMLLRRTVVAASQTTRLLSDLRVHGDQMRGNLALLGGEVGAEQRAMAQFIGRDPSPSYLGLTDHVIDTVVSREPRGGSEK